MRYQIVLTKADKLKAAEMAARTDATKALLAKHPAAFPEVLATSSRSGAGMPELRAAMPADRRATATEHSVGFG